MSVHDKTKAFLEIASQFQLGHLVTEGFHPDTRGLSQLVKADVSAAYQLLQRVDRDALEVMKGKDKELWQLTQDIQDTLKNGHRVYMCGCGATGRLSLVLETLFRQKNQLDDRVRAFMAGGDFALIKSVESFEDRMEYGERQLMELGFGPNDLLLASSEGGETAFVIGAAHKAASISSRAPYFLYCNPDELLGSIERSKKIIEDEKIKKLNLTVGPMAISGSTRMQASTVLMLAIGVGLLYEHPREEEFTQFYLQFLQRLGQSDYSKFASLTALEAELYQKEKYLNYLAHPKLAISILTDTTERSPTFSLRGFENNLESDNTYSLSYLFIPETPNSTVAWNELLCRSPRALEWPELEGRVDLERIFGFDISQQGLHQRRGRLECEDFIVDMKDDHVVFRCQQVEVAYDWGDDLFFNHLMVKMLLNAHSTLIMGLLDRFDGNVMTWVRPSNNKLIDRAARYVLQLLEQRGKRSTYAEVVAKIFEEMEKTKEDGPVVMKVLRHF